jgi:predicted metalloprotease with PDZ domain
MRIRLLHASVAAFCLAVPLAHATDDLSTLRIKLRPVLENGVATALDVEERLSKAPGALTMPASIGPLLRIADRVTSLVAKDTQGPIDLTVAETDASGGTLGGVKRSWKLARPANGELTVTYRVAVSKEMSTGPAYELRSEAKGISGQGQAFLVLPDDTADYKVEISWDGLQPGEQSLTSYPAPKTDRPLPLSRLRTSFFMAGPLDSTPKDLSSAGPFRAASTADIADPATLLAWTAGAYDKMYRFFGLPTAPNFTVMYRTNMFGSISGVAGPEALVSTIARQTPVEQVHGLQAHEMVHVFITALEDTGSTGGWFTEGTAVHYQRRFPLVAGLATPDEFLRDVNHTMRRYYANVRNMMPMADAIAAFWTDARGRVLPYDRGAIYFADMDAKIRAASNGKRSLDDVIREFLRFRRDGKKATVDAWLDLVARDIGAKQAHADYQALQDGKVFVLPSNAFGPCFKRIDTNLPVFELGFAMKSLTVTPRVIAELDPASPAAKAGVRNGDKIVAPVTLDLQQTDPSRPIVLKIDRDGQALEISFKPEGAKKKGYLWERVNAMPDAKCAG